eukprot:CAMPEP_0184718372 /NCGR_PEP_ID=MMETSP0314-20130426/7589_1 /TAXON_ID=38298 /ORGANISM="Rhodella maculata, Strain CCMP 736" /LENGTH=253 /DNA_ID=CAMNT_0027182107 /DNA_START=22 /DNA_END=783 /DNA_ORIENTATION=-
MNNKTLRHPAVYHPLFQGLPGPNIMTMWPAPNAAAPSSSATPSDPNAPAPSKPAGSAGTTPSVPASAVTNASRVSVVNLLNGPDEDNEMPAPAALPSRKTLHGGVGSGGGGDQNNHSKSSTPPAAASAMPGSAAAAVAAARRRRWTTQEDEQLVALVARRGAAQWDAYAREFFEARTGRQLRLRWMNHLRPAVRPRPWSSEEDAVVIAAHKEMGNSWVGIARKMEGRSDNDVKNRFHTLMRRMKKIEEDARSD